MGLLVRPEEVAAKGSYRQIVLNARRHIIGCLKEGGHSLPSSMRVDDDSDDHRWTAVSTIFKEMPSIQERTIGRNTQSG